MTTSGRSSLLEAETVDVDALVERFTRKFGRAGNAPLVFRAPGRVNLLGEHTDRTGGLVFPCGIDRGTHLVVRRNGEDRYRFASTNFELMGELGPDEIGRTWGDTWINYPLGVMDRFRRRGATLDGIDCLFSGNIPNGAGLSSSASIEIVTALALDALYGTGIERMELVKMAQAAENEFVGMSCGIMDQFAVAMARDGHAMLLDCATLEHRQVPLALGTHVLVVANTNQRRELNESAYNERVAESDRAFGIVAGPLDVERLGDVTPAMLESVRDRFDDDPVAWRRALHVATENERVRVAVPALEAGDLARFGELMDASHASLRDRHEVSSGPLDALVSLARARPGTLGARLTGAGFGGCTVNLVEAAGAEAFAREVGAAYTKETGLTADFYRVHPGPGAARVER